jgi:hypothetical protein
MVGLGRRLAGSATTVEAEPAEFIDHRCPHCAWTCPDSACDDQDAQPPGRGHDTGQSPRPDFRGAAGSVRSPDAGALDCPRITGSSVRPRDTMPSPCPRCRSAASTRGSGAHRGKGDADWSPSSRPTSRRSPTGFGSPSSTRPDRRNPLLRHRVPPPGTGRGDRGGFDSISHAALRDRGQLWVTDKRARPGQGTPEGRCHDPRPVSRRTPKSAPRKAGSPPHCRPSPTRRRSPIPTATTLNDHGTGWLM